MSKKFSPVVQNGDPPLLKSNAQLKLFDGTLMQPVGEIMLTAERRQMKVKKKTGKLNKIESKL